MTGAPARRRGSKVALVCAGGGVTGAVYEVGCLRALEELLDRSILDLDLYVGISGGAVVTSLLAGGFSPVELYDQTTTESRRPFGQPAAPLFRLHGREFLRRWLRAPSVLRRALTAALTEGRNANDLLLTLLELLPAGLLDNSGLQEYVARLLELRGHEDRFDALARELYLVAVDIDTGEAVAFGEPGWRDVPVSRAVQASTALPGLYQPVRIGQRDYVDGGVKKTAHINLAIGHGADLVICINPIVPILNDAGGPLEGHLSNRGISYVLDQALRIMLHGRMQYGLERYAREHPEVDVVLIEPVREDMRMFSYNIMRYAARRVVARYGYRSALASFRRHEEDYRRILARHGIRLADPAALPEDPPAGRRRSVVASGLALALSRLEARLETRRAPSAEG